MPNKANIVVYNDAGAENTFVPEQNLPEDTWVELNTSAAQVSKARVTISRTVQKNGILRRLIKVEVPVMEALAGASTLTGYLAAPKVAHTVVGTVSLFTDPRASDINAANCLRMLIGALTGDTAAGVTSAYIDATDQGRQFMVHDLKPS